MDNQTDVSIKFTNSVTGQGKLEKYAKTLSIIKATLSGLDNKSAKELEKSANSTKEIATDVKTMSNLTKVAFNYTAIRTFSRALQGSAREISRLVTKSSDYLENINLFQVAFNGAYKEADRFINKMSEMYGLDESNLTRTVGIFKQLSNAMNLSTETGTKLATLLTQMTVDISSLYNIDVERASSVLQSSLAGQTKPIRGATGADITQTTLQTTLDNIGIKRYIGDLSYAEKRLLIIISLTQQLSEATNDFGRTIESPANQMRILNEQWERLSRAVGNLFLPIMAKVLPYLNAVLMVLTEIINMIASLFGYKADDYDYFTGMADSVLDLEAGLGGASENAKKLKQGLRGFDKLNVISTPSAGGKGSGIGGGISPEILDEFNKAFDDYNSKLENVKMRAIDIRDAIMKWLGFTKHTNKETKETWFTFEKITGGTVLGALMAGGVIFNGIKLIYGFLKKIGLLKFTGLIKLFGKDSGLVKFLKSNPKLLLIAGAITLIGVAFKKLYDSSEEFRNSVDNFINTLGETFKPLVEELGEILLPILKMAWEFLKKTYNEVLKPLGKLLIDTLEPILSTILNVLSLIFKEIIQPLLPILSDFAKLILPVINTGLELISKIIQGILDVLLLLWKNVFEPFVQIILDKIHKYIIPAIESIGWVIDKIKWAIQKVVDWWNNLSFNKKTIKAEYQTSGGGGAFNSGSAGGRANGGVLINGRWQPIQNYALGGLPPVGQMFVAREKGPELVGNLNGHTAVMNNDQIVASVSNGVYKAVSMANTSSKSNDIFNIYLDQEHKLGTYTLEELKEMARSNGEQIVIG